LLTHGTPPIVIKWVELLREVGVKRECVGRYIMKKEIALELIEGLKATLGISDSE